MSVANINEKIQLFGRSFKGRLDEAILEDALEYIDYNEPEVSLDILFEQLYEYKVKISEEEHSIALQLVSMLNLDEDGFSFLKELL